VVLGHFDMLAREARWRHLLMHAQVEGSVSLQMPRARFDFTTDMTCLYNRKDTPQETLKELASSVRNTEELQRVADGLYANVRHWTPRFDLRRAVEMREAGGSRSSTPDVGTPDTDVSWGMPQDPRRPTDPRMAGAAGGAHARGGMSNPAAAVLANGVPRDPRARPGGAPARSSPLTLGGSLPEHHGPAGSARADGGAAELPFGPPEHKSLAPLPRAPAWSGAAQRSRPAPGPGQALSAPPQHWGAPRPPFHPAASSRPSAAAMTGAGLVRAPPRLSHASRDNASSSSANEARPSFVDARSSTTVLPRAPRRQSGSRAPPAPQVTRSDAHASISERPRETRGSLPAAPPRAGVQPITHADGRFAPPGPHRGSGGPGGPVGGGGGAAAASTARGAVWQPASAPAAPRPAAGHDPSQADTVVVPAAAKSTLRYQASDTK
jgi:hypothetical protein